MTEFEENQQHLPRYNLHSVNNDDNLVLSDSRLYQMSHSLKVGDYNSHTKSGLLVYPSYRIATFQDLNGTVFDHSTRNTKRAIFVDLENKCVPRDILMEMASKLAGQGVHMLSMLFAKHLPCPVPPEPNTAPVTESPSQRKLRLSSSEMAQRKNKKSRNPFAGVHPGHSRPRLNSRDLRHIFSLLPYGVRSTVAASQARAGISRAKARPRDRLLDCSCAAQHQAGRELIHQSRELQKYCTYHSPRNGADETDESLSNVDEFNAQQMSDLAAYYEFLPTTKFVLSPANAVNQSHCEWEALTFGAIPLLVAPDMAPEMTNLYRGLPVHVLLSIKHIGEDGYLPQLHSTYMENMASRSGQYSFAKLFHPYWLAQMQQHFTYGKPAQRPWRRVDLSYKKMKLDATSCSFDGASGKQLTSGVPGAAAGGAASNPYAQGSRVDPTSALPERFKKMSPRPKMPKKSQYKGNIRRGGESRLLRASADRRSVQESWGSDGALDTDETHRHLLASGTANTSASTNTNLIELVLPRCCESGLYELEWLTQLLSVTPPGSLGVSLYYKCLECLPASLASRWLAQKDVMFESDYQKKHNFTSGSKRITLLDDSALVAFGTDRVKQFPQFDRVHNGKEVTAYLQYIIDEYQNLPKQVVFLHTSPHAHLHLPLFTKFVKYVLTCDAKGIRPVDFMHLNVHYKGAGWGQCCGKKGRCRESTWKYLFSDYPAMGKDYIQANTYSSAQFVASRGAIGMWPVSFWEKMKMAINGEHDLDGCPHSSDPNTPSWGGHQLTGQYERMWHIIFGQNRLQTSRKKDPSLPYVLRMDCLDDECKSGAL
eukprot:CAMPEP_0114462752 /NCGR_PEP_ID=MMETSP0104-20121206/6993_1 /TAXON_ID=37642 ORGANISM="Paraphysomonas imperforata, Strain PA2" /NCGR_SAMPLE_ID=MMETSP0104 /ASSEMBLY_ACC=CAM_ASM_000202 /LENGTH=822 /DNA_ID=CAMNT_0001635645 /DNA_START=356 /DNA_END=2824 /DNA_ORIENTATION=-